MNQYQKVYMNQIHSSSLLGQLAQMWRSQMLCDALIRTGNITTKAHRVVLVAACPMLQSMDNASVGSHLEVRLAADIKQEAVNSFLQYLYEGFMMLTEENCKDVEKVARLLQVDSVTKCCIDFYNCLQKKTGVNVYTNTQYKYSSADLLEFRHVRTTDLQKTIQERMMKRASSDSVRPASPGGKRQRTQQQRPLSPNIDLAMFGQKADDTLSMTNSYMGNIGNQAADPWERVPRIGAAHRPPQKPGVIEIVEDSLEILQTQPPDKDASKSAPPVVQKSLAISVSSQLGSSTDVHVVNVNDQSSRPTAASDGPIMSTGRDSITVSPLTVLPGSSISSSFSKDTNRHPSDNQKESPFIKKSQLEQQSSTPQRAPFPVSMSPARMSPISQISQVKKSFAAGSATQAATMSQSQDSSSMSKRLSSVGNEMADRPPSSESGKEMGAKSKTDDGSTNSADMAPDLSIIKVEPNIDDPGLDMYVDVPDDSMIQTHRRDQREHDDESDVELEEASGDWSQNEMSNEAAGSDQNNSWYIGQFKDWLKQKGESVYFEDMAPVQLNNLLVEFYRENLTSGVSLEFLQSYPYEISRYLSSPPFNRNIDLQNHPGFESSCHLLREYNTSICPSISLDSDDSGNRPISFDHLRKLYKSGHLSCDTPETLRNKVWVDVNLYFGVFNRKLLRQLDKSSFVLEMDSDVGRRYYRLADDKIPKNSHVARMYEQPGNPLCPVSSMLYYYSRLHPNLDAFFQQPDKTGSTSVWYHPTAVGKNVHSGKLSTICRACGINLYYRNTALRSVYRCVHAHSPGYTSQFSDSLFRIITGKDTLKDEIQYIIH